MASTFAQETEMIYRQVPKHIRIPNRYVVRLHSSVPQQIMSKVGQVIQALSGNILTRFQSTFNGFTVDIDVDLPLDKLRKKGKYPEKYIHINLPEYTLKFFANDSLKSVHNLVIGTTDHQTPQLRSKVHTIVVYPYWNVPYSIASKEILPALQANKNYLTKNNYKIYRGENEVNPYSINWKKIKKNTFPYKVVQQPGPKNSLGIIKFEFHNNYSVYIHDTPSKSYFRSDVRSFSHGCMRCENPVELGKLLLTYDSIRKKPNPITAASTLLEAYVIEGLVVVTYIDYLQKK
jgi:hypothetical protein